MKIIKSETAQKKGLGSCPHRSVTHLTKEERAAVKAGATVYFEIYKTHYTQSGYKIVTIYNGRYDSREPTKLEFIAIKAYEEKEINNEG